MPVLDIKWIRENPQDFDRKIATRGMDPLSEELLALDRAYLDALRHTQELQTERNKIASEIGVAKKNGGSAEELLQEGTRLRGLLETQEQKTRSLRAACDDILMRLPNLPLDQVPVGKSEQDNQEISTWGDLPTFSFSPLSHEQLGLNLGMDFEAAGRMSGSRFVVLKGELARLERALAAFMLDTHSQEFGYIEVSPPYLVRSEAVYGVGQLPKFQEDLFQTTDNRWLISTAEVSLTNLVREQNLKESELPLRYTAYTPCFRSEAGSAGKDTHGMVRLHQFSKVELVHITTPQNSESDHQNLLSHAEAILQKLKLPYRVMLLCTGDIGAAAAKTYDIEVWLPGQNAYREISSCSNCLDYQARRMNARFRNTAGNLEFVHTLNGSGLAVGRTLVAVLENYQQKDGSLLIPEVLQPYMRGQTYLKPLA